MKCRRLEILVEEPSMELFLQGLLPRILPDGFVLNENCFVYPHEGKDHLQKRLPNRVRAYQNYPEEVLLMVVQDQDSHDCVLLKSKLIDIVEQQNVQLPYLIRIACRELENWYLGDFQAIENIYPNSQASKLSNKAKYRNVDKVHGADELKKIIQSLSKSSLARNLGGLIAIDKNRSVSFQHFYFGIKKLLSSQS